MGADKQEGMIQAFERMMREAFESLPLRPEPLPPWEVAMLELQWARPPHIAEAEASPDKVE